MTVLLAQAVWALGNIAGDSPQCRDLVLGHHALEPLLGQLKENSKISMLRNATWTLSNFCRGKPQPSFEQVDHQETVIQTILQSIYKCVWFSMPIPGQKMLQRVGVTFSQIMQRVTVETHLLSYTNCAAMSWSI